MTPSSVMRIGSLAKQFTAAAILLLAEEGKLAIDDPLARFLPEVPNAGEVRLRHLLTHTSGLGASQPVPQALQLAEHDSASLLAALLGARPALQHPPGARWIYNNFAYKLLGLVVERTSGVDYSHFIRTRLAERAGLTQTAVDEDRQLVTGRASGYAHDPASPLGFKLAEPASMSWHGAAGNMRSTASDLCRYWPYSRKRTVQARRAECPLRVEGGHRFV
jgi:CubicO group peptidase (beta-lactamase class C family)